MNDVNLNGTDLRLVRSGNQSPALANASPQNEGNRVSAQVAPSPADQRLQAQPLKVEESSRAEKAVAGLREQAEQLNDAVSQLNNYVQSVSRDLQFEVDNKMGQTIVKVVDQETQEVIRQIPDEVALRLAQRLHQDEPLTLFNVKV